VDAAATAATLLLVVASSFLESLSATVFITLVCLANASQLYGYLVYLPYYRLAMNHLKVACASALVWASVCMAMAQFHGKPQVCTVLALHGCLSHALCAVMCIAPARAIAVWWGCLWTLSNAAAPFSGCCAHTTMATAVSRLP
jgi:hypothetical protein